MKPRTRPIMFTTTTGMEKNPAMKMKATGARSSACSPLGISTYTSVPRITTAKTTSPVIPNPRHAAPRAFPPLRPGTASCRGSCDGDTCGPEPFKYGAVTVIPPIVGGYQTAAFRMGQDAIAKRKVSVTAARNRNIGMTFIQIPTLDTVSRRESCTRLRPVTPRMRPTMFMIAPGM